MSSTQSQEVARSAHEEWDYRHTESQFSDEPRSVSLPCQLIFTEPPSQNTDRFHSALKDRVYTPIDSDPDRGSSGRIGSEESPYYDGEVCSKNHYNRIHILVFRTDVVRIYPHDDYVPAVEELAELLESIVEGFDAMLKHDPIETEDEA